MHIADSEIAALTGVRGEILVRGCVVQIEQVTDRAAKVKALRCPDDPNMMPLAKWVSGSTEGWVAKSALDLSQ